MSLRRSDALVLADSDPALDPLQVSAHFRIVKLSGDSIVPDGTAIHHGDIVAFQTGLPRLPNPLAAEFQWVNAVNGGGAGLGISGWMTTPQAWERFKFLLATRIVRVSSPEVSMITGSVNAHVEVTLNRPAPVPGGARLIVRPCETAGSPYSTPVVDHDRLVTVPAGSQSVKVEFTVKSNFCINSPDQHLREWEFVSWTRATTYDGDQHPLNITVSRAFFGGVLAGSTLITSGGTGTVTIIIPEGVGNVGGTYTIALNLAPGSPFAVPPGGVSTKTIPRTGTEAITAAFTVIAKSLPTPGTVFEGQGFMVSWAMPGSTVAVRQFVDCVSIPVTR